MTTTTWSDVHPSGTVMPSVAPSQAGCVYVNGRFFEPQQATVSVLDAGFVLGDGLFESLRVHDGVPYLLERHLLRLLSAADELEFEDMPAAAALAESVGETVSRAGLRDAYLRLTVTRGSGVVGLSAPSTPPTVVIAVLPAPAGARVRKDIEVTLLEQYSESPRIAKSTSWQHAVRARRQVVKGGADEGLYVSPGGHLLEGVTSNVFVFDGEQLLTPPICDCLPGITRGRLLELARADGLAVSERALDRGTLMRAALAFVTNAVQGLRKVRSVSGTTIGSHDGDRVFDTLCRLYEEDRRAYTSRPPSCPRALP
jgi:branched-subunit amino acid aminotransferase/4-amino-4-deoxychorismate lyase